MWRDSTSTVLWDELRWCGLSVYVSKVSLDTWNPKNCSQNISVTTNPQPISVLSVADRSSFAPTSEWHIHPKQEWKFKRLGTFSPSALRSVVQRHLQMSVAVPGSMPVPQLMSPWLTQAVGISHYHQTATALGSWMAPAQVTDCSKKPVLTNKKHCPPEPWISECCCIGKVPYSLTQVQQTRTSLRQNILMDGTFQFVVFVLYILGVVQGGFFFFWWNSGLYAC
jgi:hypothetical protein